LGQSSGQQRVDVPLERQHGKQGQLQSSLMQPRWKFRLAEEMTPAPIINYCSFNTKLLGQRLELLDRYAGTYKNMTDEQATQLAGKVFDWEEKRTKLKRTWFKKFSKVVPRRKLHSFSKSKTSSTPQSTCAWPPRCR
jgi:hypothetical protein